MKENSGPMQDRIELVAIHSARQGDQRAWDYLFDQYFKAVYSFSLNLASGQANIAEDVTQETFMVAARKIHRFRASQGEFRSWLCGIARKRHLKLTTSCSRRQQREQRYAQDRRDRSPVKSSSLKDVFHVFTHMDPLDRSLLEAKYLEAKTVKEIAQDSQISEHAAESRLRRARDRFARIYQKLEGTDHE